MPWEPYVEFANFICKFGDDTNMLDLAEEIVVPAFLNHDEKRVIGSSTFFLYDTSLINVQSEGREHLCLVGRFIQDTKLTSKQTFDEEKGIVQGGQEIDSAPSAIFALVLENHKLLYFHETPNAPGISAFRITIDKNLRAYYKQYSDDQLAQRRVEAAALPRNQRPSATSLRSQYPRMTLEILPLTSEQDFTAFINSLHLLTAVQVELVDTNDEIDSNPFFQELRQQKDDINSVKSDVIHKNDLGLNKEAAIRQLTAAKEGNSRIKLTGINAAGNPISGDASRFKTRVVLPFVDGIANAARQMVATFQAFKQEMGNQGVQIDQDSTSKDGSDTEAKLKRIRDQFRDERNTAHGEPTKI